MTGTTLKDATNTELASELRTQADIIRDACVVQRGNENAQMRLDFLWAVQVFMEEAANRLVGDE